jgi:DNA-binding SARP family transcriptional activator
VGVNLDSRHIRRTYQHQPVSSWSRETRSAHTDHPLRVYTLGRFAVQVHNQALSLSRASHHRPLRLLQALIALGGREVHAELISHALWPDAEGDAAQNVFDVTLHRLRRLLGISDLLRVHDHRLTLNSNLAWVDAWSFERLLNHSERLLARATNPAITRQLARCDERILNLYQGAFLEREAAQPWTLTLRERLRSKLLRYMQEAGRVWESSGEPDKAIRFYNRGLEIDPLTEQLYQRLMICYRELGRTAEALATFQRCRRLLNDYLRVAPSRQTLDLYSTLKR